MKIYVVTRHDVSDFYPRIFSSFEKAVAAIKLNIKSIVDRNYKRSNESGEGMQRYFNREIERMDSAILANKKNYCGISYIILEKELDEPI